MIQFCKWRQSRRLLQKFLKEIHSMIRMNKIFRWKKERVLLVILGLHKVEFFFDPVNGFQNVDFKSWRNWSPTNTTTRRAWWLKMMISITRCNVIILFVWILYVWLQMKYLLDFTYRMSCGSCMYSSRGCRIEHF